MLDVAFAVPGDIDLPTGGYAYARKLLAYLQDHGVAAHHVALPSGFPYPDQDALDRTGHILDQISPDTLVLFDGLAFGALPPDRVQAIRQPIVALVHHPLAYETGVTAEAEQRFRSYETEALAHTRGVIVSSPATRKLLVDEYGVKENAIAVAIPGTDPATRASGSPPGAPLALLAIGSVIPRKGYDVLLDALARLSDHDWSLKIIGATDLDPAYANKIRQKILESGLRSRIELAGKLMTKDVNAAYANADVFVMSSHYEGYGMVLTEAISHGLPIVCTTGGAMADTAPDDAALKVPPGDVERLAAALGQLMGDKQQRATLADAAWARAQSLQRWSDTARIVADALRAAANKQPLTQGSNVK